MVPYVVDFASYEAKSLNCSHVTIVNCCHVSSIFLARWRKKKARFVQKDTGYSGVQLLGTCSGVDRGLLSSCRKWCY